MFRAPALLRSLPTTSRASTRSVAATVSPLSRSLQQTRQAHAISNPTLANIEKRWEAMPPQEQADLWMALRDRMKVDWNELTLQEKKAAYWIAFGPHGPRAQDPPGETAKIVWYVTLSLIVSGVIYGGITYFARPAPSTMNKEWQQATEEYLKENNVEPITGISSPDWKGNFSVQSPPSEKK